MKWATLAEVRAATAAEFGRGSALARRHHFVKLALGGWTRTLGPPGGSDVATVHATGARTWRQELSSWGRLFCGLEVAP